MLIKKNSFIIASLIIFFSFIFLINNLIVSFPWFLRFDPDSILILDILGYASNHTEAFFQHPGYGSKLIYGNILKILGNLGIVEIYNYETLSKCNFSLVCVSEIVITLRYITLFLSSLIFFLTIKIFDSGKNIDLITIFFILFIFFSELFVINSFLMTNEFVAVFFTFSAIYFSKIKGIKQNFKFVISFVLLLLAITTKITTIIIVVLGYLLILNFNKKDKMPNLEFKHVNFVYLFLYYSVLLFLVFFLKDYSFRETQFYIWPPTENPNILLKLLFVIPFFHIFQIFLHKHFKNIIFSNIFFSINYFYISFVFFIIIFSLFDQLSFLKNLKFLFFVEFNDHYDLSKFNFRILNYDIVFFTNFFLFFVFVFYILIKNIKIRNTNNIILLSIILILILYQIYQFRPIHRDIFYIYILISLIFLFIFNFIDLSSREKAFFLITVIIFSLNNLKHTSSIKTTIHSDNARYGYNTYFWYNANFCDEIKDVGVCKYSRIIKENLSNKYNETIHFSKQTSEIKKNIRLSLKNCKLSTRDIIVFQKYLNLDVVKDYKLLNFSEKKLENYIGLNLNNLKCKDNISKYKIEISNDKVFAHGYYEPFIKYDNKSIYSISKNYIYDTRHYSKKNVFRENLKNVKLFNKEITKAVILPENSNSHYIITSNKFLIDEYNFLIDKGLIQLVESKIDVSNFKKQIYTIRIFTPIIVRKSETDLLIYLKSLNHEKFWQ